ncbi:MAG: damage-inducible protein D [Candidatus Competibacter denitrificans]
MADTPALAAANEMFHFDDDKPSFEDLSHRNGATYWYATDLMKLLGYDPRNLIPVNKAMAACAALNIPIHENFISLTRDMEGKPTQDFKLTRFACYLTAMNGDSKKPAVALAQAYFATLAEVFSRQAQEMESVERVTVRDEISTREVSLNSIAKQAGVSDYARFQNAGYRGLYNMNIMQLRRWKRVPGNRTPLDFMGKTELAANLFRITQTEEKIHREGLHGQGVLENTAEGVGREVRQTMQRISGIRPESLPPATDIRDVKKGLKTTYRELKKIDTDL